MTALLAALAAGIGGAALVELLATRPRRRRAARGATAIALLGALGRQALGAPTARTAPNRADGGRRADLPASDRIAAAGVRLSPEQLDAIRVGAALVGAGAVVPLAWTAPGRLGLGLLVAGPAAGHLAPILWLRRRARRRAEAVERELADVLDLLRVGIGAGLAPMRALAEVGRRHHGILAGELRRAAARRALGLPAAAVISDLERRCPTPGVAALCAALDRADRHGAPLADTLRAQARQARSAAAVSTAEDAARASPRIQLVVALLLVPSVLMLVAAGLLPALTGG